MAERSALDILVVVKSTATLRMLSPLLRGLDARGHRLQIATKEVKTSDTHAFAQRLAAECSNVRFTKLPYTANGGWSDVARGVRTGLDYLRYLEPRYRDAPKLRARAGREVPPALRRAIGLARRGGPLGVAASKGVLRAVEQSLRPSPRAEEFLASKSPDVLVIAPLVGFGSSQADLLRAARRLGVRSAYPVPSWDNLTNKGLLRDAPDLVLVWNELQAAEAVELHGMSRESVRVTGAPAYDHWFDWKPSRGRTEFCRDVGLDPERPYVLYAASSAFIARDETAFFRRWLAAVRDRGGALEDVGVLVRPHPLAASQWTEPALDDSRVVVWPRGGEFPLGEGTREHYFDSIFHSAAVVGINTSAMIESAIVGRPVHTVLADEYRVTQEGTLHFQYLVDEQFGHVRAAATLPEHAAALERSIFAGDSDRLNDRFLRRFVRPHGLDVAATALAVAAVEELAGLPAPAPSREPALAPAIRLALRPLAGVAARRRRRLKAQRESTVPFRVVKRAVRDLARGGEGRVVAGEWTGDEVTELLYWIPFLRWAVTANLDLAGRLVAVAPGASASWYAGVAEPTASAEAGAALEPALLEPYVEELAAQDPWAPLHSRVVEFAPLVPDPPAEGLPDDFVAVHDPDRGLDGAIEAVREWSAVVPLGDRATAAAILARARAYLGSDPVSAVLAVLTGTPAFYAGPPHDALALAGSLGRPPYGPLRIVGAAEAAGAVRRAAGAPAIV